MKGKREVEEMRFTNPRGEKKVVRTVSEADARLTLAALAVRKARESCRDARDRYTAVEPAALAPAVVEGHLRLRDYRDQWLAAERRLLAVYAKYFRCAESQWRARRLSQIRVERIERAKKAAVRHG